MLGQLFDRVLEKSHREFSKGYPSEFGCQAPFLITWMKDQHSDRNAKKTPETLRT
jgi:hypothetical protein